MPIDIYFINKIRLGLIAFLRFWQQNIFLINTSFLTTNFKKNDLIQKTKGVACYYPFIAAANFYGDDYPTPQNKLLLPART